jgi:serine/threonine-protein kinase
MAVATKTTRTQAETDIQGVGLGSLADGVSIGPYEVVRFLGRGGMGEVYEVLHTLLGKRFALKLISKELSQDEKARNLFRREGREAGNLDHPNIVRVDDCGEVD